MFPFKVPRERVYVTGAASGGLRPKGYPQPGGPYHPLDPRHFDLDDDETLLPQEWMVQVRRVRTTARGDLRKILETPPEERVARVEETESRRSFRSHALAGMLLEESRALLPGDALEAAGLAEVAERVLHWVPGPPGELWRQTARGRALAHRANALRCAGDLTAAEEQFQRLHSQVLHERLEDPRLTGESASWEAALRWRQGQWEAAVELLGWSVDGHRRRGARLDQAQALGRWADVLRAEGRPGRAAGCLEWAARLLEPAALAAERSRFLLRLGEARLEAGRRRKAVECLRQAEDKGIGGLELERAWLAARLDGAGGGAADGPEVRGLLRDVRKELAAAGRLGETVLVVLDELAVEGGGGDGERERAVRWLGRRVAKGEGLEERLREWAELAAGRVKEGIEAEDLAALRRGMFREVTLAGWGAV